MHLAIQDRFCPRLAVFKCMAPTFRCSCAIVRAHVALGAWGFRTLDMRRDATFLCTYRSLHPHPCACSARGRQKQRWHVPGCLSDNGGNFTVRAYVRDLALLAYVTCPTLRTTYVRTNVRTYMRTYVRTGPVATVADGTLGRTRLGTTGTPRSTLRTTYVRTYARTCVRTYDNAM